MGNYYSKNFDLNPVNYHCPVCMSIGHLPNAGGRFFLINEKECQCNGCNSVFEKSRFYKTVVSNAAKFEETYSKQPTI